MQTRNRLSFLGIGTLAALLAGTFGLLPFVHDIELSTYDLRVRATARASAPPGAIAIIEIGDDSIRRMEPRVGRWPWPRLVHATVIDYLAAAGAKVIAYDILFAERDLRKFVVGDAIRGFAIRTSLFAVRFKNREQRIATEPRSERDLRSADRDRARCLVRAARCPRRAA